MRKKLPSGTRVFKAENKYASAKVELTEQFPETICIEFVSEYQLTDISHLTTENVLGYVRDLFHQTGSTLFAVHSKMLNQKLLPSELKRDVIIITPEAADNADYYFKKIKSGRGLLFRFELYIHTSNCLEPDSCQLKFHPGYEDRQTEETNNLIEFCHAMINSQILTNNKKFKSKIFSRNRK